MSKIHEAITAEFIAALSKGVRPWHKSWDSKGAQFGLPLRSTGEPYKGINILTLWAEAQNKGYANQHWFTFNQCKALGGSIRKGEKGSYVVFMRPITGGNEVTDSGEIEENTSRVIMRAYTVFNFEQCDNLPESFSALKQPLPDPELNQFFQNCLGNHPIGQSSRAAYSYSHDQIIMPPARDFISYNHYQATLAHELIHWTGHKSRLDREIQTHDREKYAFEELIAEIGAAFTCAHLGIRDFVREENESYVGAWLQRLGNDPRYIFRAASLASKAFDFLLGLQP